MKILEGGMPGRRCVLLLLIFGSCSASAEQRLLSLEAAVEQALQRAPVLNARAASVDAARALAVSAGRLPDPQFVIGIDNLPVTGPDAYSTTRDFMTMRKVGVVQEFPRAAKRRLQHERAAADAAIADAQFLQTRLEIARDVAMAWIRRASAEASLAQLRTLEPEVELQAAAAKAGVAAGRGSTADALAAQAAIAQLANRALRMRSEASQAGFELARWLDADATLPLAPMPSLDRLPTPGHALLASVHEHGSLLPYQSRAQAARIDVDLARAERRPDFSAALAFAKRGPDFSDMVSLEFRVGLPLFARNRQDPVVAAKHAQLRRLEAEREDEVRMHTAELQQTITQWELLNEQLRQYEQELLPLARERSRAGLAAYRAGRGDLRMALDAFVQEIDFVIEHAQLQNERGQAWAYLRYLGPEHLHQHLHP